MPEARYPTMEEFWRRLEIRHVEPDLRRELRARLVRESGGVRRLSAPVLVAVVGRLVPGTVPPEALAAFVDEHFDKQLGRGDERAGLLPRAQLIPLGLEFLDAAAQERHGDRFPNLTPELQDTLLTAAERAELPGRDGFDWAIWFRRLRGLVLLGLGSDPRGMVFMGFPGPSYQPGHLWLDEPEVAARSQRHRGHLWL